MAESTTAAAARQSGEKQLTCFVVTGFGNKTDYTTGRVLNLDKTYEQIVRPACDNAGVNCFRAIDANLTGSIDSIMYRWIYQADIVIADLSTLNANVFYELGVRHAQKPYTTIIIAESVLMRRIPFDLSHFVIHQYDHGGEKISEKEQERFVAHLSGLLDKIIAIEKRRRTAAPETKRESDSPVFQFLRDMTPPAYREETYLEPPVYVPPDQRETTEVEEGKSLANTIDLAEAAKKRKDFPEAVRLFRQAIEMQTEGQADKKPDVFLAQRLALVTYKNGEKRDAEGKLDKDKAIAALEEAEEILARYCAPRISNDPETLGLSGAINKRKFELTGDLEYLERAIESYERGFYVKQDYYNGINVAYMYTQRANLLEDRFDAIVSYGHANMIRKKVAEICEELMEDEEAFAQRGDRQWIYMTMAEAYQGMGESEKEARLGSKIEREGSDFAKDSYQAQKAKLAAAIAEFEQKVWPGQLSGGPVAKPPPVSTAEETKAPESAVRVPRTRPGTAAGVQPITIDADIVPDKPIKSVEVHCKIEYA